MKPITYQQHLDIAKKYTTILNSKNMEPKNKINWARIWQIIQAIITMILATETATRSL